MIVETLELISTVIIIAPLVGALIAGFFGNQIGPRGAHRVTILAMAVSFILSLYVCQLILIDHVPLLNRSLYTWGVSGNFQFNVGLLVDPLSAVMTATVCFISLIVHIYSIGYMRGDPGYQRFFSYISLFTFAMLALTLSNNFLQLYFGWEGVGLASYLLIGFWFKRESANQGSLKAFLVNRVGDFGFLLGIATLFNFFDTVNYATVFAVAPLHAGDTFALFPGWNVNVLTTICILLFVGAMGKSAQVPLHVWLPESMEGPTPISALIHAATMVTAGIYMVCRMSPLFEYSPTALSFVLIVGATGALFMGMIALVQTDIKRVVAYSTLSQLGYMVAALGVSAYAASMFHLVTHAFFKALLFLAAGSVILSMHHVQDMRAMGGLRKYMPVTYLTFLIGSLALCAIPPFAGFYSKDLIIEAIGQSHSAGSTYAYICVVLGTFVTALYSFRALFMTFHGNERMDPHTQEELHEQPAVITAPLIILAIFSVIGGLWLAGPFVYDKSTWLGNSLFVLPQHTALSDIVAEYKNLWELIPQAMLHLPFWFALSGIGVAWLAYIKYPLLPSLFAQRFSLFYHILISKYGFDAFNNLVFVRGSLALANWLFHFADLKVIDDFFVLGSSRVVTWASSVARRVQSGYLYHYALIMVVGLLTFLGWFVLKT